MSCQKLRHDLDLRAEIREHTATRPAVHPAAVRSTTSKNSAAVSRPQTTAKPQFSRPDDRGLLGYCVRASTDIDQRRRRRHVDAAGVKSSSSRTALRTVARKDSIMFAVQMMFARTLAGKRKKG
jgi:hypothetical protein